jgi:NAD(P)-dependent dehydrogenase (short-subunit alcohol dehydrogenase family)
MYSVEGKRIVVTGAARGIGLSAARALGTEGAAVVLMDITDGTAAAKEVSALGPQPASFVRCDISARIEVERAFERAHELMGGIDGLVNAAGIENHVPPEQITDEVWDRMLAINVTGTYLTNTVVFRYMKDRGGRILNFGSDAGLMNYFEAAHYSASKGAVMAWTRSVAAAWGKYKVTVNSIVPAVWTPMYDAHRAIYNAEELAAHDARMAAVIPIGGRLGDPDRDLAPVLVFMLSDGSRYMTGQIVSVNGGANGTR